MNTAKLLAKCLMEKLPFMMAFQEKTILMRSNKIVKLFIQTYQIITSSIAFYPSVTAFLIVVLGILTLNFDDSNITTFLKENASFLVINNTETARSILTTLIGGGISLIVFSFSMVMVTLNQASSNFSPRLLPGLISEKKNQIILGFYLGTVIFNILVLISILPSGDSYTLNIFSILIGIILGISSLSLFIYFIHNISSSIQISNILKKIFLQTKDCLNQCIEKEEYNLPEIKYQNWNTLKSERGGYFQGTISTVLENICDTNKVKVFINAYKGQFVPINEDLVRYDQDLSDEVKSNILNAILFNTQNNIENDYVQGINQITEVGVKAMSPGINDPATALVTIDYLSYLFQLRMQFGDRDILLIDENEVVLEFRTLVFKELLEKCFTLYRQYCKNDIILMKKLLDVLNYLLKQEAYNDHYLEVIRHQIDKLKEDAQLNIKNKLDLKSLISK